MAKGNREDRQSVRNVISTFRQWRTERGALDTILLNRRNRLLEDAGLTPEDARDSLSLWSSFWLAARSVLLGTRRPQGDSGFDGRPGAQFLDTSVLLDRVASRDQVKADADAERRDEEQVIGVGHRVHCQQ